MNMRKHLATIDKLMEEARRLINQRYFEEAIFKLKKCLNMENELKNRAAILDDLEYCFLRLGWYGQ